MCKDKSPEMTNCFGVDKWIFAQAVTEAIYEQVDLTKPFPQEITIEIKFNLVVTEKRRTGYMLQMPIDKSERKET